MDEEAPELHGQLLGTDLLVALDGCADGPSDELCRLLTVNRCGPPDHRARGPSEDQVDQDLAQRVGVVGSQHIDGQESIEFMAE
jgi:hypothetical protein